MKDIEWKVENGVLTGEFYCGAGADMQQIHIQTLQDVMPLVKEEIEKAIVRVLKNVVYEEIKPATTGFVNVYGSGFRVIIDHEIDEPTMILPPSSVATKNILADNNFRFGKYG